MLLKNLQQSRGLVNGARGRGGRLLVVGSALRQVCERGTRRGPRADREGRSFPVSLGNRSAAERSQIPLRAGVRDDDPQEPGYDARTRPRSAWTRRSRRG